MSKVGPALVIVMLMTLAGCHPPGRNRQREAMADLRAIGASAEAYAADHRVYPAARTIDDLAGVLEPSYMQRFPRLDPWNEPFRYAVRTRTDGRQTYRIASAATDRLWEQTDLWSYASGTTMTVESDIVFGDGEFIRAPEK
jgi:hypothetical protein